MRNASRVTAPQGIEPQGMSLQENSDFGIFTVSYGKNSQEITVFDLGERGSHVHFYEPSGRMTVRGGVH